MASYNGAFPGPGGPAQRGLAPEPTRARSEGEAAPRPQLGTARPMAPLHGSFPEAATELSGPASEPPPAMQAVPLARDEEESIPPPPPSSPLDAFAEFEGQISGENTRIDDSDLLSEQSTAILGEGPRLPYLLVESGKDLGKEYVLQEGETSIGRGIDNDVILSDVSVSRRHVRVLRDGDALTLRDLGSGNGTQLNGRRAHVETLNEGDRIELGETVLVLRVPGAELPAIEGAGHTHETVSPISGGVAVLPPSPLYGTPHPVPTLPPVGVSTDSMSVPGPRTQSIVLPRRLLFIAAGAVAIIGSVIGAGVVTVMGRDPEPVVTGLPVATSGAGPLAANPPALGTPTLAAPSAVGTPSTSTVAVATPGTPTATPLPDAGVALVVAPAEPVVEPVEEEAPAEEPPPERPTLATHESPDSSADSRRRIPRRPDPAPAAASSSAGAGAARDRALAAYRSADFVGAARIAREAARTASTRDRPALVRLADQIDTFATYYPRIRGAGTRYASVSAIGASAIQLDERIAHGHHTRAFRPGFVGWLLDQAEAGMARDPVGACQRAGAAAGIEPSPRSRALLARCETRAGELAAEARRAERSDPTRARDLYRSVIRLVPGSTAASDAQHRLDALGRARSVDEDE